MTEIKFLGPNALPEATLKHLQGFAALPGVLVTSARPSRFQISATGAAVPALVLDAAGRIKAAADGKLGAVAVTLDERPYPLWLRAGTDDGRAALASLEKPTAGFQLPFAPRRILELGAGIGLRSVALALRFPDAEILSAEPDPACHRLLKLNTLPYPNITPVFSAVGAQAGRYSASGPQGTLLEDVTGPIAAVALARLLAEHGWAFAEMMFLPPHGPAAALLQLPWHAGTRLMAVETPHAPSPADMAARFPEEAFLTMRTAAYTLIYHRKAAPQAVTPRAVPVFCADGPVRAVAGEARLVPGGALRLEAGQSATVMHECRKYSMLHAIIQSSSVLEVTATVLALPGDEVIGRVGLTLHAHDTRAAVIELARYEGPCRVVFSAGPASDALGVYADITAAHFI